ncbi:hypothetical protein BPOR_0630g00020 [Botrytis porri]|uniref:Uncharacterized protein n=1 Tax=Botrytis porri TaxID=87229 RepID=A0A4Z1KBG3_9HELO|nr:hypothetical protein BPOR_0630g00020 [Botrytis porri]
MDILIAGSEITAFTLTSAFGTSHVISAWGVVMEALAEALLPRMVPGEGHNGSVVDGKVVSPGTMIGISAYTDLIQRSGIIRTQGARLVIKEARAARAGAAASPILMINTFKEP